MQLTEEIKGCNGCGACAVVCREHCIKMVNDEATGVWRPTVDDRGCNRCNACKLYCPLFNPVELPEFSAWYAYDPAFRDRNMAPVYRAAMRSVHGGQPTRFAGTLCQIAALKSLLGDKLPEKLEVCPLDCRERREDPKQLEDGCRGCRFYG